MTVSDWIAFGGLLVAIVSGGVSALVWLLVRIGRLETTLSIRMTRIETIIELAFPLAKEQATVLESSRRVVGKRNFGL
jgi:hypothetical protein